MDHIEIIKALVAAMKKSVTEGCTDDLDCCLDRGEFWYNALEDAAQFLDRDELRDAPTRCPQAAHENGRFRRVGVRVDLAPSPLLWLL